MKMRTVRDLIVVWFVLLGGALGGASAAAVRTPSAANPSIAMQTFRPGPFPDDILGVRGVDLPPGIRLGAETVLVIGGGALVFVDDSVSPAREDAVVAEQMTLDLIVSATFFERAGVAVALPLYLLQRGEDLDFVPVRSYESFAVGDLRVSPTVVLLPHRGEGWGLSIDLTFTVPTAQRGRLAGDAGVTFTPTLVVAAAYAPVRLALDLAYHLRENRYFAGVRAVDELRVGLGAAVALWSDGPEVLADLRLATPASEPLAGAGQARLEALLGMGYRFPFGLRIQAAGGAGILDAWGSPAWRVVAQVGYDGLVFGRERDGSGDDDGRSSRDVDEDADGDGVENSNDRCPMSAEDRDGFQDEDGCPDLDNDGDGVPDLRDGCPDDEEDRDGFQDEDGCPDLDNDGDGFPDGSDRCPDRAETSNGFEDDDGCPDVPPIQIVGDRIVLADKIRFAPDDGEASEVAASSLSVLRALAAFLIANPDILRIRVEAHTDDRGPADANLLRSRRRARAVVELLVSLDVLPSRLMSAGFGETRPLAPNVDEESREDNNRVDFIIIP